MEKDTFMSQELEEMRSQINILKDKLQKQAIVNEQHIRNSMKTKMSDINRIVTMTIVFGFFALAYCTWFFCHIGLSLAFTLSTAIMLAVCVYLTIRQKMTLNKIDFSSGNLVEVAKHLSKVRTHYHEWIKIALPLILLWFSWLIYEVIHNLGVEPMTMGFCTGAALGVVIGGFLGYKINRKVVNKANEILDHIKDLEN